VKTRLRNSALVVALLLAPSCLFAQDEPQDIVVAGKIVARVRDRGAYSSTMERAQKINANIVECISRKEVGVPKMALKEEGSVPTIYCGTTMLIKVYAGDAKPNGVPPKTLALAWMKNLERELPNCEPMTDRVKRLGAAAFEKVPPEPPKAAEASPTEQTESATAEGPAEAAPAEVAVAPPAEASPAETESSPEEGAAQPQRGVAQLVVLDTFSMIRGLSEDEYEQKKDQWANNLIARLRPFLRSAATAASGGPLVAPDAATSAASTNRLPVLAPPPGAVPEKPSAEARKPAKTVEATTGKKPAPKPAEAKPAPAGAAKPIPVPAAKEAVAKPIMPSGEGKVSQKMRIRRKMDAAKQPYLDLRTAGDPQADQVGELLKGSREKFYAGDFDDSEEMIDAALKMMGVSVE
jgi:hypothetical protein